MRLTDLRDKIIRTLDGEKLGRVHEVHCEKGRITALICGPGSLLERLTARKHGRRIPWECVRRVDATQVVVTPDPPQRIVKKSSAARSRQGTRRPSAPRSKR
jgi:sporulation protein YlmC with PRC-barrel domain